MKKILVATDFTNNWSLFDRVLDLIKDSESPVKVILVHTYLPQHSDAASIIEINDRLRKKSKEALEDLHVRLTTKLSNPKIHWEVSSQLGTASRVVKEAFAKEHFHLVALSESTEQMDVIRNFLREKNCRLILSEVTV